MSGAAIVLAVVSVILQVRSQATRGSLGIKWFRPSAELRDSLFGLEALKEKFSVERETRANRQLYAQQYRSGAWYVSFTEGGLDSMGPSAGCHIEVTEHPTRAFESYLPSQRVDANGARLKDPSLSFPRGAAPGVGGSDEAQDWKTLADTPRESPESLAKYGFLGARYYTVPLVWGDEIWAGVYRSGEKTYGNVVVARKNKLVIHLAWRGPGLDGGEELLAFVKPYLDGIAELEPGERWVAEWLDESQNTY
jgi:hypothetical protein